MFEKYSRTGASRNVRMSLRFAFSSPAHVIATFGGSGLLHPAPGTWGTAAGLVVYIALERRIPLAGWIAILLASFFLGAWASHVTGKDMGVHDHGSIVIDEVAAIWLTLLTVPATLPWQIAAFVAFRFFDIVKLPPTGYFDASERWKNGWGVMLDDVVAAVQAIGLLYAARALL